MFTNIVAYATACIETRMFPNKNLGKFNVIYYILHFYVEINSI